MAEHRVPVRIVLDAGTVVEAMARMRTASEAHPPLDGEDPIDWLRRVIDAAYWRPSGYDDPPEAPSPASGEEF